MSYSLLIMSGILVLALLADWLLDDEARPVWVSPGVGREDGRVTAGEPVSSAFGSSGTGRIVEVVVISRPVSYEDVV